MVVAARAASVLVVDDDELIRELVGGTLDDAGYSVVRAVDGNDALQRIAEAIPDLIVSDVQMPDLDGFGLVDRLRADPRTRTIPLIFLTTRGRAEDIILGLGLGADDYVVKPFDVAELVARVESKLARRPVPVELLPHDPQTGMLSRQAWRSEVRREIDRAHRSSRPGGIAVISYDEAEAVRSRLGGRAIDELARQIGDQIAAWQRPLDVLGRDPLGRFLVALPETSEDGAVGRLADLSAVLAGTRFVAAGERVRISPVVGFAQFARDADVEDTVLRATTAATHAAAHLDLRPVAWRPGMAEIKPARDERDSRLLIEWARVPFQIAATWVAGLIVPFVIYWLLDRAGYDITPFVYIIVVVALLITGFSIWLEGLAALRAPHAPEEPGAPYPQASAIIAAYLPNEAATIMETIEAFKRLDYPAPIQVIVAYNTPRDMPIERDLRELAELDARIVPFRVRGSTSKAQNVNAALALVDGEFVGVFDADHQPQADAFARAWRWLSNGWDVVQGHCLVRNGDASGVARTVAVEFETIYAVSHPGRAKLHGFGIFGGSNGYWRADLLARTRMRGTMLTEDIDSSLRVVEAGGRIASDPGLISRELGPATLRALWNQRMRWAQGWFQVSLRHLWRGLRSPNLSLRNKVGLFYLLGWREVYPWLSLQMFPVIAFMALKAHGTQNLDWFVPIFVLTTLFTLSVGPWQTLFSYRLAAPEIRARRRWFVLYLFVASILYTEFKNLINRVAQIKELMHERAWKVTPRAAEEA